MPTCHFTEYPRQPTLFESGLIHLTLTHSHTHTTPLFHATQSHPLHWFYPFLFFGVSFLLAGPALDYTLLVWSLLFLFFTLFFLICLSLSILSSIYLSFFIFVVSPSRSPSAFPRWLTRMLSATTTTVPIWSVLPPIFWRVRAVLFGFRLPYFFGPFSEHPCSCQLYYYFISDYYGGFFSSVFFLFFYYFLSPLFCLSSIHPKHKLYLIDRSRSSSSSSSLAFRRPDLNATYSSVFSLSLSFLINLPFSRVASQVSRLPPFHY